MGKTTKRVNSPPTVKIGGSTLKEALQEVLLSVEIVQNIQGPDRLSLVFKDPKYELFDAGGIDVGAKVEVDMPDYFDELVAVFAGSITAIGIEHATDDEEATLPTFVVQASDESHRLAAASKFEAHEKKAADVVKAIGKRHGLKVKLGKLPEVGGDDYILQAGTDHALLNELAHRYGCEWFTDGETLHFRPRPPLKKGKATVSRDDGSLERFTAHYTGVRSPKSLDVLGWDPATAKKTVVANSAVKAAPVDLGADAPFVTQQAAKAQSAFGQPLLVGELASVSAKENEAIATSLVRDLVGSGLRASGEANCNPLVRAGEYVTVEGCGKRLSGTYYVTEVVHSYRQDQALMTNFTCSGHVIEPTPWSPSDHHQGGGWARTGPVVGVVTNINDKKKLGRVKVRFPSLGDVESTWARVVSVGAGPDRGFDFRPEPNDEVLVAFERGDARFPLVLGGLWNGKSSPPKGIETAGDEDKSVAKSRAIRSRGGHTLEFGDGAANEAKGSKERFVSITTGDTKNKVVVNEKEGIALEVPDGNKIVLKAGATTLTLTDKGDVEITTAKGKFVLKANQVAVEGKTKLEVKGTAGALIDGGPKLDVKSSGMATVQAGGILTLKGSMVKIN